MSNGSAQDVTEVGRRLGHDLFRFRQRRDADALPSCVAEGMALAKARNLPREPVDRFVGKWLQIRVNALKRGRVVDDGVTPDYLRRIDVPMCPVTRLVLTHGTLADTDSSVDRLHNDGAYAPNNLAVMSVLANRAKGTAGFDDILRRSRLDRPTGGLAPVEWLRLAVVMAGPAFAGRASRAPSLPLVAFAPCAARPLSQVTQWLFTVGASHRSGSNALVRHFGHVADARSQIRLERFTEAMHRALKTAVPVWDAWMRPGVFEAFDAWQRSMDPLAHAEAARIAIRLARAGQVSPERIRQWRLADGGYLQ